MPPIEPKEIGKLPCAVCGVLTRVFFLSIFPFIYFLVHRLFLSFFLRSNTSDAGCECAGSLLVEQVARRSSGILGKRFTCQTLSAVGIFLLKRRDVIG